MSAALQQQLSTDAAGTVLLVAGQAGADSIDHGAQTRRDLGRRVFTLMGYAFGGDHRAGVATQGPAYFIPSDTLLDGEARALGIRDERDLFGGVVPHVFMTTKTISHPAIGPAARFPEGWSHIDVLVVEAEKDEIIPPPVIESFVAAFGKPRSLTARKLSDADHGLTEKSFQSDYNAVLVKWLTEMIVGARAGDAASQVERHKQVTSGQQGRGR